MSESEDLPKRRTVTDGELGQLHNKYSRKRRRTKTEIAADREKEAEDKAAKEREAAEAHAESLRIAAKKEDEVQRRERQISANAARPDLATMAAHQRYLAKEMEETEMDVDELAADEADNSEGVLTDDLIQLPPMSTMGTDSEPDLSFGINEDFGDSGSDDEYKPEERTQKGKETREKIGQSTDSDVEEARLFQEFLAQHRKGQKKKAKAEKKPERGALRAQIERLRDEPTPIPAPQQNKGGKRKTPSAAIEVDDSPKKGKRSKPAEIGGFKANWKKLVNVDKRPPSNKRESSPDFTEDLDNELKGEFVQDESATNLAAARKYKTSEAGVKKSLSKGTAQMGITLQAKTEPMDVSLPVKGEERPTKSTYSNSDLPFENPRRDLKVWQHQLIPDLYDWAGTLDQPFAVNAHPDFDETVETLWEKYFPTAGAADEAVRYVAQSALRNWRSEIGKRVLVYLKTLFANKPFNNSPARIEQYVNANLSQVLFIYRNQDTMTGAYRSDIVLDAFSSHLRHIVQIKSTHGDQTGAMSLCLAAVERGLTLWKVGKEPPKKSFVANPWAERAHGYLPKIKELSARKWGEIYRLAAAFIKNPDFIIDLTDESKIKDDMRADVQLSPDEDSDSPGNN